MLVVVCLKEALRSDIPIRLDPSGKAILRQDAVPADEGRLPAHLGTALALKQKNSKVRVLALAVGPSDCDPLLRNALALGADDALRVWPRGGDHPVGARGRDGVSPPPLDGSAAATLFAARAAAGALAGYESEHPPALLLAGAASGDTGHECFGAFLAWSLGSALAHRAVSVHQEEALEETPGETPEVIPEDIQWRVTVKVERGYGQEMVLPSPAVVTVAGRGASAPRPSLPSWLAALGASVPEAPCAPFPSQAASTSLRPPIPRVKRFRFPDENLDAEGRIRAMVSLPPAGGGALIGPEASPKEQAARAAEFLREAGYL